MGTFGDKFRKEREKKGISLDDVSNVTKIGSRMLQAIEEERFDQLPGGVFNKGFIRAYAKHLGLNDEAAVTDYLACLRQAQIDAHEVWEPVRPVPTRPAPPEKRPLAPYTKPVLKTQPAAQVEELPELQLPRAEDVRPPRKNFESRDSTIPWRLIAVAAVILVLGIILWTRHSRSPRNEDTAAASPAPAIQSAPAPIIAAAPLPTTPKPTSTTRPANAANATPSPHPTTPNSQPPAITHPAALTKPVVDPAATNAKPQSASTTPPPAKPAPTLTLVIRAQETSWISVTADGQSVSQETLIAPAHTSIRATREIVARVGNAAGVSFLWNGKEIPAEGAEAEVKTYTFDAQGMHAAPSSQPADQNR